MEDTYVIQGESASCPLLQIESLWSDKHKHEARKELLACLQAQIREDTDKDKELGWLTLHEDDAKTGTFVGIKVPARAFICASLARARAHHLMPAYTPRSPKGLKMFNDCQFHSDAWIGAGMDPDSAYNDDLPEQRLFLKMLYELQRQKLRLPFDVLSRGSAKRVSGEVTTDPSEASKAHVLVLREASAAHAAAALRSAAVIVEHGSKLAHLVVLSREEAIPVIRVEGATHKFVPGRNVYIDLEAGAIQVLPH